MQRSQTLRPLRDVHGVVTDALEIVVDLQHANEQPQIDGDRLLQREEMDDRLLDAVLHLVDLLVPLDDLPRALDRTLHGRVDSIADLLLHLGAHDDQLAAHGLDLLCEMLFHDSSSSRGKRTRNVLPTPTALSTSTVARCSWARCLTMASPRPEPGRAFDRERST